MRLSIYLFIILFAGKVFATNHNVSDSLRHLISNSSGTEKLKHLNELLEITMYENLDSATSDAEKLKREALKLNNKYYLAEAYRGKSIIQFYKYKYYKAEENIKKAIAVQKELHDTCSIANSYRILTSIYWETERYNKSIETSFKALDLYEKTADTNGIVAALNNIGLIYTNMKEYDKALLYHKKALKIMRLSSNKNYWGGDLFNNLGISYKNAGIYDSALIYYRMALHDYKNSESKNGIATAFLNIANIYSNHVVNTDSALYYYKKSLEYSKNSDLTIQVEIYGGLGMLYAGKLKDFDKSIEYFNKELKTAKLFNDYNAIKDAHYNLSEVFTRLNNYKKAYIHLKKSNEIKDSLNIEKAKIKIANLESKFQNEKNLLKINDLEREKIADGKIRILLISGIALLTIIGLLLLRLLLEHKKKNKLKTELLKVKNEKLEEELKHKTRELTSRALMMIQKNKLLNEIVTGFSELKCPPDTPLQQKVKLLMKKLEHTIRSEEDWNLFQYYFEEVNKSFYKNLYEINPNLTASELKLSALIKLNFSIKESAALLNISPDSVKTSRSVLRKKLGLKRQDSIYNFLSKL